MTREQFLSLTFPAAGCALERGASVRIGESVHLKSPSGKALHFFFFTAPPFTDCDSGSVIVDFQAAEQPANGFNVTAVYRGDAITPEQAAALCTKYLT
jgi:hypothetical protein